MKYADVIVPVPLDGCFTYSIPPEMERDVVVGGRVVVEFGARKKYSAIVAGVHDNAPGNGIEVKPIVGVTDAVPVVEPVQISFWKWIAAYYICSIGEVMTAAMPAGMKLASESVVSLNADDDGNAVLSPLEQKVADILATGEKMSISTIEEEVGGKNIMGAVRSLYDKGVVKVSEVVETKYKPRQETRVELAKEYFSEKKLDALKISLEKQKAQLKLLNEYLKMSSAVAAIKLKNRNLLRPVAKSALIKSASASSLNTLCKNGVLQVLKVDVTRLKSEKVDCMPPRSLSKAQERAYNAIAASFAKKDVCLLHGVTSSGKTEIYIHLIARALAAGRSVLYLLPEIALTTQITNRLKLFFGNEMGVYHSKFPDNERVEIWKKQMSSKPYRLIVGVRSSLFLPHRNLGLVIVDEEHEPSYKQEDPAPRYNARDAAIVLASQQGAKTLLGTATPSLESYSNAKAGKYALVTLSERYGDVMLPEIRVENVKELRRKKIMKTSLSPELLGEMGKALEARQQVILFQNRRGYASYLECRDCGWIPKCSKCDVSLTWHKAFNRLSCHYCGATYSVPKSCPKCGGSHIGCHGVGTEQVEADVKTAFPQARTARLDLDTTRGRTAYADILSAFRNGSTDILIGTQMVSKGLDFDKVKVVGILNADTAMNIPDFRSHERAFQMMAQVAGRAGRRNTRGIVVLQTSQPDSEPIAQVVRNDYIGMYDTQMQERGLFVFPPYCRLIYVFVRNRYAHRADDAARALAEKLLPVFGDNVLGPANPPVARVKFEYIRQIMLKVVPTYRAGKVREFLRKRADEVRREYHVSIYFDVDPL